MKDKDEITANVWVICPCGDKHLLKAGIDAPYYWCGDEIKILKEGDELDYDEVNEERE